MQLRKPTPGTILQIPLDETEHTYARVIKSPYIAVYDCRTEQELSDLAKIVSAPILFIIAVYDSALKNPRWRRIGRLRLQPQEAVIPDSYTQDDQNPNDIRILSEKVDGNWSDRPGTLEECEGLERASVWDLEHVEERIRDHYAGRPNVNLLAGQLIRAGQVFSVVLVRDSSNGKTRIVSGHVHGPIEVGDKVSIAADGVATLTVAKIEDYQRTHDLSSLSNGSSGTLHLAGNITPEVLSSFALFKESKW